MGCTLSKVSNDTEKDTSVGQKSHRHGLRHWVGKKRRAFIRLVRPSHFTPPQSEDYEEPPKDISQKPQPRRRERRVTPETLLQNASRKRASRRHHVKEVLSSSQEDIPQDNHSRHRIDKTLIRKQTPYHPFDGKPQEEVSSSDVSQLYEAEEEPRKRATRRNHVKEVLSSSQEDIPQDNHSRHRTGKTLVRKQTPYYPFDGKPQEEVFSSDVSQLYEAEKEPDDDTPSICQLDITPEGCEWCEVTRRAERRAVLRRKAKYKRKQNGETTSTQDGWDSEEEQKAYLAGKEWQEKRKRIDKWVEDGIREMKAKKLRWMMKKKKLEEEVRQKQDKGEDGIKMDLKEQSEYQEEVIMKQEKVEEVVEEVETEQQPREGVDEEQEEEMVVKRGMEEKETDEPHQYLKMEERSKEEEMQREEMKKSVNEKIKKYFAARLEMRMQAVSERAEAEARSKGENHLQRCRQMKMEEKGQKDTLEMERKKREEIQTREETERKSKKIQDPINRVSFDFQDSVDELTRRKVKKTVSLDPRQKEPEVKGKRGHASPMEELDVAINELLAKNDAKSHARHTSLKSRRIAVPSNTPTLHGIAPSVASRYQGGVHFQATCSSSNNVTDRGCPPITKVNQMTSQRRRLPRPNAAYGDRPYPPTTGRIPDSAWEFFQRQRKH